MQTRPIVLRRAALFTAGAAIAYLVVRHIMAVYGGLGRDLDADETEYLHAGWLLHQGLPLYRGFVENHAPFLFVILKWMVPAGGTASFPKLDLVTYVTRARIFSAAFGLLALSTIAVLAYRASRSLIAPLVTIAALMSAPWTWSRGLVQIRNDPPALFLFWLGALMLLGGWRSERLRFAMAGLGIGLAGVAFAWNPKWPFESLVLGVVYLVIVRQAQRRGTRMLFLTFVPPALCLGITLACIAATASLGDYYFFTFRLNRLLTDWISANPYLTKLTAAAFHGGRAYMFCPPAFKGVWPVIAVVVTLVLLCFPAVRRRLDGIDVNIQWVLIALAAAATLEIRFLYPYPNVWTQYYVMWSFIAACLYGTAAAAWAGLLPRDGMRLAATAAIALVASFSVDQAMPLRGEPTGWPMLSYLQRNLKRGETVWIDHHPIGVPDAGYYWFSTRELVPFAIQYTARHPGQTPLAAIMERDLPVCRAEHGLQPDLRFVSGMKFLDMLPEASSCLERMIATGRAVKTPAYDLWDLHPCSRLPGECR